MGDVCGYYLTGGSKSLYIAGDTVFTSSIAEFLKKNQLDVIILNCCEATMPDGRLIMDLNDVKKVHDNCHNSKIILTHLIVKENV